MKSEKPKKESKGIVKKWDINDDFDVLLHELLQITSERHAFIKVMKQGGHDPLFIKDLLVYYEAYN